MDLQSTSSGIETECKSCGNWFVGKFCNQCGEKIIEPNEKSIKDFLGSVINGFTSLDGKFIRTLKIMLTRPGEVSYHYMNGRRVPFIKPMSMFLIANLIYFLFPLFNSLNSSLYVQMNMLPHSKVATQLVEKRLVEEKIDFDTFQIRYNQQSTNMAKMVLILMVVYFSIPLSLINFNRRMFYSDHLMVSLEICSLIILVNFVALIWLFKLMIIAAGMFDANIEYILNDQYIGWASGVVVVYLFFRIERKAYSQTVLHALWKSVVLFFMFFAVLQVYRGSLFFVTLWTA